MKRYAMRRDGNEKDIVRALEDIGCTVTRMDYQVDLLVGYRSRNFLIEIKDPAQVPSKRTLTPAQKEFFETWKGQVRKVETAEEAIRLVTKSYKYGSNNGRKS